MITHLSIKNWTILVQKGLNLSICCGPNQNVVSDKNVRKANFSAIFSNVFRIFEFQPSLAETRVGF
jgi:hypothetical protein